MRLWPLYTLLFLNGLPLLESSEHPLGEFTGRISRLNTPAALLRIRVRFENLRYLTRGDRVDFSSQENSLKRCQSTVKGKTNDYILLKVPFWERCTRHVHFTVGAFLHFYSQNLLENIKKGKEVVDILLKKRIALESRKRRFQKELESYDNKVGATHEKYQVLREKLEKKLRGRLSDLENDKSLTLKDFHHTEIKLNNIDYKLEQYRVSEENLEIDRWSLDRRLYFKK